MGEEVLRLDRGCCCCCCCCGCLCAVLSALWCVVGAVLLLLRVVLLVFSVLPTGVRPGRVLPERLRATRFLAD